MNYTRCDYGRAARSWKLFPDQQNVGERHCTKRATVRVKRVDAGGACWRFDYCADHAMLLLGSDSSRGWEFSGDWEVSKAWKERERAEREDFYCDCGSELTLADEPGARVTCVCGAIYRREHTGDAVRLAEAE